MIKKFLEYFQFDSFFLTKRFTNFFYKFFIEKRLRDLFYKNNLDKILNLKKIYFNKKDIINDPISKNIKKQYNPEIVDLARIYNFVKQEKPFTILEFGVGYSTIVMAQALYENYMSFDKNKQKMLTNLCKSVEELELSVRSYNCLKNANIEAIAELVQKTDSEMLRTRNFGRKSLNEIKEILDEMGLHLGMKLDEDIMKQIAQARKQKETVVDVDI